MEMIKVNHSLNKKYFVEKPVLEELIKKASKETSRIKLLSYKVKVLENSADFKAFIEVEPKKGFDLKADLLELTIKIEDYSNNLIGSKPENITITVR